MRSIVKNMALFLLLSLGIVYGGAMAQNADMLKMLQGMKIDKAQINQALEQLEKQGIVNKAEAEMARKKLNGMSDSDIQKLKSAAVDKVQSGQAPPEALKAAEGMKQEKATSAPQAPAEAPAQPRMPSSFNLKDYK